MPMTWEQMGRLYLASTGDSGDAHDERWEHLNAANRWIFSKVDVPEHHIPDATVDTTIGQDWVDVDDDLYALDWIVVNGRKLDPEWNGMRGRARFIDQGSTMPPSGEPKFYVRQGAKVYLRPTPDAVQELLIGFRFFPAWVNESTTQSNHPISPPQYDMAILQYMIGSYFELHPPRRDDGSFDYERAKAAKNAAREIIAEAEDPVAEERLDSRSYVYQPGYDFGVRGR